MTIFHFQRTKGYPWRSSTGGPKGGLKVVVNTHPETSIDRSFVMNSSPGVMALVIHPSEWPINSIFIGAGSASSLSIKPTAFSTSDEVRGLDPIDRQCYYNVCVPSNFPHVSSFLLFQEEADDFDLMTLKGLPYMRVNCLIECQQVEYS